METFENSCEQNLFIGETPKSRIFNLLYVKFS